MAQRLTHPEIKAVRGRPPAMRKSSPSANDALPAGSGSPRVAVRNPDVPDHPSQYPKAEEAGKRSECPRGLWSVRREKSLRAVSIIRRMSPTVLDTLGEVFALTTS